MFDGGWEEGQAERLPPHNTEAEESVLGSVLLDKSVLAPLAEILRPEDFYRERNGVVWRAMLDLLERQIPVDYLLLMDELERSGKMTASGGAPYVAGLMTAVPTPIHAEHYARIVAHCSVMRRLISAGGKISTLGFENRVSDAAEAVDRALGIVQEVMSTTKAGQGPAPLGPALDAYVGYMEAVEAGDPSASTSVPTGMTDLDAILGGGMQRSDLIVVGARPSIGKTSAALNVLLSVAKANGAGLMFSLEMPMRQIVGRLLALESGVEATTIRQGVYTDVQVRRIGLAINSLRTRRIYVDEQESLTVTQIRERARKLHEQEPLDFIIVDHLQLVQVAGRSREQNRTEQLGEITRQLKNMARELEVPVMALSQLSRAVENRPGKKIPELRDLRESGSSEQDADVVAFLYRESYYDPDTERQGLLDVIVAKHRNGRTGQLTLIFNERTMQLLDLQAAHY